MASFALLVMAVSGFFIERPWSMALGYAALSAIVVINLLPYPTC
jgi:hypothetical protein